MKPVAAGIPAALAALTLAPFLARFGWPFEMLGFFRPHYAALSLAAAVVFLPFRRFIPAGAAFVLVVVNLAATMPWERPGHPPPAGAARLRLLLLNVWDRNDDADAVAALLRSQRPDVVGLTELTPAWARALAPALGSFRARAVRPEASPFGIGLYSRVPLTGARIARFGSRGTPSVVVRLQLGGRTLTLVLIHPPPPYSPGASARHRSEYRALASMTFARPVAICGDLNAPPWSWAYDHLASALDLRDANRDRLAGTWPSFLPAFLRIPIDTCLLSDGVTVTRRETGPEVGSDHVPVLLELAPAA